MGLSPAERKPLHFRCEQRRGVASRRDNKGFYGGIPKTTGRATDFPLWGASSLVTAQDVFRQDLSIGIFSRQNQRRMHGLQTTQRRSLRYVKVSR